VVGFLFSSFFFDGLFLDMTAPPTGLPLLENYLTDLKGDMPYLERLWQAAREGRDEEVKAIFEAKPTLDPNMINDVGDSALHIACEKDHAGVVSVLLRHPQISPDQRNGIGTPHSLWLVPQAASLS